MQLRFKNHLKSTSALALTVTALMFFVPGTKAGAAQADSTYNKLFDKEKKAEDGLFRMHLCEGKVYMDIPRRLFGRDMLLGSTISATSDNKNGISGSKPEDPLHFVFTEEQNHVAMRLVSEEDSDLDAIFRLFKKECYNADSSAVVINATDLFLSDDKKLSPFDRFSYNTSDRKKRSETFRKSESFIEDVKAFDDNVSVKSSLSYKYTLPDKGVNYKDLPFTASVTRSILLLDSIPYMPRLVDSRIAIFPTEKRIYGKGFNGSKKIYYANRWRLEPSDIEAYKRGEKVAPLKPVVFYIDSAFPESWKPYIKEGVEQWNEMFGEIGFKDAVKAVDFPEDDPSFDPDNLKYSSVRYVPIPIQNAMGPSWTDPRSGEIINATVYLYHDAVELINNWLFVQTAQVDTAARHANIDEKIVGDALRYVVSHEIGHCLGFMHNMSASANVPLDSLRSASYTQKYGTTTSIMDYARFNYVAQPEDSLKGLKLTPPRFGQYDRFVTAWNYTPTFSGSPQEEYTVTSRWLTEALGDPLYRYGKQQDEIVDPRSQTEDLSDDAVGASAYGISNLKYILSNMNDWLKDEDLDYSRRRALYNAILNQYLQYIGHVYGYVGGICLYERFSTDPGVNYEPVSASYQRKALGFILQELQDLEWFDNKSVLDNFPQAEPMSSVIRDYVMKMVMGAPSKTELCASKSDDPFTPEECMEMIFNSVWSPLKKGDLTAAQMQLQRSYLESICGSASVPYGKSSRSLRQDNSAYSEAEALYHEDRMRPSDYYGYILRIKKMLKKGSRSSDKATSNHCTQLLYNLDKSLEG